jgi:SAM-dependent methyltransferase
MNATELRLSLQDAVSRHGAWLAHNIHLGEGVYTIGPPSVGGNEGRLRRIIQICADLAPLTGLRVADLGSGEGALALEFAARGAHVVAVDGREANLGKIRFAKTVLGLDTLEIVQDDVRNFTVETFGEFDIIVAVGIVYHLDVPEVFDFLANVRRACTRFAVIDSEVLGERRATDTIERDGIVYRGSRWKEPAAIDPHSRDVLWAAIDNPYSFMFTRDSLANALQAAGFRSVLECHLPAMPQAVTRVTALAIPGRAQEYITAPTLHTAAPGVARELHLLADWRPLSPVRRLWRSLPESTRARIRRRIGRDGQ